jgi:hypothetical protein
MKCKRKVFKMKKITKREKLIYITFITLLLSILLLSVISDVYARYSNIISGSGNIELAKWSFKVNGAKEGESFSIDIKTTDETQNKISPESTGTFTIIVENASNMPALYTIELAEHFMNTQIETDAIKIYTDDTYKTIIDMKNNVLKGKLNDSETKVITLYWKWVTNVEDDQLIAENYDGFTITANVTGEQTIISENENIEMKIENKI